MLLLLFVLQATHSQFRRPEDLKCPKCGQAGVLQGNGFRQGTRCVLHPDGQEKVFSHGMTHKECPAHGGKGGAYHLLHCYSAYSGCDHQFDDCCPLSPGGGGFKARHALLRCMHCCLSCRPDLQHLGSGMTGVELQACPADCSALGLPAWQRGGGQDTDGGDLPLALSGHIL